MSVTAIVHDTDDRFRELDDGTRRAWQTYSEQLREVPNADYERVEHESWEELQRELRRIERRRKTLTRNST